MPVLVKPVHPRSVCWIAGSLLQGGQSLVCWRWRAEEEFILSVLSVCCLKVSVISHWLFFHHFISISPNLFLFPDLLSRSFSPLILVLSLSLSLTLSFSLSLSLSLSLQKWNVWPEYGTQTLLRLARSAWGNYASLSPKMLSSFAQITDSVVILFWQFISFVFAVDDNHCSFEMELRKTTFR